MVQKLYHHAFFILLPPPRFRTLHRSQKFWVSSLTVCIMKLETLLYPLWLFSFENKVPTRYKIPFFIPFLYNSIPFYTHLYPSILYNKTHKTQPQRISPTPKKIINPKQAFSRNYTLTTLLYSSCRVLLKQSV